MRMFRNLLSRSVQLFRGLCAGRPIAGSYSAAGYKSQYNQEYLYPESNRDFTSNPTHKEVDSEGENAFSGYIPVDDLDIRYTKSSGPGGQNVNKRNTKVEVRFNVDSATWIPDWIKPNILQNARSKINKDGYLIVTSDRTRKALLNQADCLDKVRNIVWSSSVKEYEPDQSIEQERQDKARRAILREKRAHSLKKQWRQNLPTD